jgi:hypothetical protein
MTCHIGLLAVSSTQTTELLENSSNAVTRKRSLLGTRLTLIAVFAGTTRLGSNQHPTALRLSSIVAYLKSCDAKVVAA